MSTNLRLETTVLPGHRLEISDPQLPEKPALARRSILEFLRTLPPGPLLFKTPEDANRFIQEERDS